LRLLLLAVACVCLCASVDASVQARKAGKKGDKLTLLQDDDDE
jgi:hypothetical protein